MIVDILQEVVNKEFGSDVSVALYEETKEVMLTGSISKEGFRHLIKQHINIEHVAKETEIPLHDVTRILKFLPDTAEYIFVTRSNFFITRSGEDDELKVIEVTQRYFTNLLRNVEEKVKQYYRNIVDASNVDREPVKMTASNGITIEVRKFPVQIKQHQQENRLTVEQLRQIAQKGGSVYTAAIKTLEVNPVITSFLVVEIYGEENALLSRLDAVLAKAGKTTTGRCA